MRQKMEKDEDNTVMPQQGKFWSIQTENSVPGN